MDPRDTWLAACQAHDDFVDNLIRRERHKLTFASVELTASEEAMLAQLKDQRLAAYKAYMAHIHGGRVKC